MRQQVTTARARPAQMLTTAVRSVPVEVRQELGRLDSVPRFAIVGGIHSTMCHYIRQ